ncbi:N-6 DNA methylase [Beutenbergia cavernae DSM 12333]|uniref:site-specific DNA-methyltransferase (adenine-specific) n=1 Tax=Beutenbergia cavernae (strain ATCC BAA-8 / DSM 12333 / CCUG 43141 / JCM 11478 / NBRC 16432 / NCIMB 13614 / HKI 0122) TaxID=471853 RepID=C5C352_BEUC1|nr:class I SAM-dependent DNA methyltransferase [Beutenbergia cavernae]ACQ79751.1 N-6 DNA methylase [Beutenbergia cavernae DSM 12333]
MSQLSSFVWSIADLLRGPFKPHQYGTVVLPFTILRRLEGVMAPHREAMVTAVAKADDATMRRALVRRATGLPFYTTSSYTLATALEDPDNLAANLVDYVNGFSAEVDVFKHFDFEARIHQLDAADRLIPVTQGFARVDLSTDHVSNAGMGDLFEHLIFKDFEASNAEAGDFYTPRDAIRLLVDLVFAEDTSALAAPGITRSVYDPAAGTGGMLSVAEEHLHELNPKANLALFAQEINPASYAIAKSDMLIKGQNIENVRLGDTLAEDLFDGETFDFALSNPPYGVDWKAAEKAVRAEHVRGTGGRFAPGLPSVGDGSMLFLLHLVAKMRPVDARGNGGRGGIVLNGSPLFNGGAGSGPSEIRGHLLEHDLVDAIVALPNDMFYNTGIATYLWILDNSKQPERRRKVQLIDATKLGTKMRKSLGSKRVEISTADRGRIVQAYDRFDGVAADGDASGPRSKVFDTLDFAYWSVTVERPLRLNFQVTPERLENVMASKPLSKVEGLVGVLSAFGDELYLNRDEFMGRLGTHLGAHRVGLTTPQRKALWQALGERDETADTCTDSKGRPEPDTGLRDTEIVPFGWSDHPKADDAERDTIQAYFDAEVAPHVPDAWIDWTKTRVGYEIPFTRHFYEYVPPRPLAEIDADLEASVSRILDLLREVEA